MMKNQVLTYNLHQDNYLYWDQFYFHEMGEVIHYNDLRYFLPLHHWPKREVSCIYSSHKQESHCTVSNLWFLIISLLMFCVLCVIIFEKCITSSPSCLEAMVLFVDNSLLFWIQSSCLIHLITPTFSIYILSSCVCQIPSYTAYLACGFIFLPGTSLFLHSSDWNFLWECLVKFWPILFLHWKTLWWSFSWHETHPYVQKAFVFSWKK